jgi:hypothetical protein
MGRIFEPIPTKNTCPMTNKNIEKYNLTRNQIQQFCDKGCSVDCNTILKKQFRKQRTGKKDGQ